MKHLLSFRRNGADGRTGTARVRDNPVDAAAFRNLFINSVTLHPRSSSEKLASTGPARVDETVRKLTRHLPPRLSSGELARLRRAVTTIVSAVYEKCADPQTSLSSVRGLLSQLSGRSVGGTREGVLCAIGQVARLAGKLPPESDTVESALNLVCHELGCATGKADLLRCMAEFRAIVEDFAGKPTAMRLAFDIRQTQLVVFERKVIFRDMHDVFRGVPPRLPSKTPYCRLDRKPTIVGSGSPFHSHVPELSLQQR